MFLKDLVIGMPLRGSVSEPGLDLFHGLLEAW